jgi:histidinol dehydrogenase
VIRTIDLRGERPVSARSHYRALVPRAAMDVDHAVTQVRPLLEQVRREGAAALLELSERFDGVRPEHLRVPEEAISRALGGLDPQIRGALEEAIRRVRIVHEDQRRREHITVVAPGGSVTERWIPVERVGLYVPGGLAVYPSSVVMNVVPAQIAGVESIAIASPPQRDGLPHPTVLAACALLGVDEVYAVGGAQAIAMFAYGVHDDLLDCDGVDIITGPGNIWVAAAKRIVRGLVGIDSEAGPTEIAVLADDTADADHVAADLISQAEHDTIAAAVLVTTDHELAESVRQRLVDRVAATKHSERIAAALSGQQSAIILVDDLDQGLEVVDAYAAEHLEIHTRDAAAIARRVRNAGAIFVGTYAPVSLGDYAAGSNHVLPTGGCACHSSGLSVQTFLRGIHLVEYDRTALEEISAHVITLAQAEDLPAHGEAISARFT